MAFCGRGSAPITPIYELVPSLPRSTCTSLQYLNFYLSYSLYGQINWNSTRLVILIIHVFVYNTISNSIIFRGYKQPLGEKIILCSNILRECAIKQ